jgi:hypothetical protein
MSRRLRDLIWSRLKADGTLVVGPVAPDDLPFTPPAGWTQVRYRRPVADGVGALEAVLPTEEVLVVVRPLGAGELPAELDGFALDGDTAG